MTTRFEVQTWTLCHGWVNIWTIIQENPDNTFTQTPETFATRELAQQAIDEFLAEIQAEIDAGDRAQDEGYDPDEFRIAPA